MKRFFIPSLCLLAGPLCVACFSSTLKDGETEEEGFRVTFRCAEYEQVPFETRAIVIGQYASRLDFAVFDADGTRVKNITQVAPSTDFGTVSVRLSEGDYTVVAVAHNGEKKATLTSPSKITFDSNKVTDTFVYHKEISVESAEAYNMEMKRCVAMVRLLMTDESFPDTEQFQFYYTGGSSTLDATTGLGCVASRQTEKRPLNSDGIYEIYTFPRSDSSGLKLTISALNAAGETVGEKVLESVPVAQNKITVYEGTFFTGAASQHETNGTFYTDDTWTFNGYYDL